MNVEVQTRTSPRVALQQIVNSYRLSQLVVMLAELNLVDLLKDGPRHYQDLAKSTGVDPDALYRCLRALASAGVLDRLDDDRFALNDVSHFLRRDVPGSLYAWTRLVGYQHYPTWNDLLFTVKTGQNAFEQKNHMSVWDYRKQHPLLGQLFDEAMSGIIFDTAEAVVNAYDFAPFRCIVDVGGGQGVLLATILKANPSARGILFDQEQVIQGARAILEREQVLSRCELVGGSFFDAIPKKGDVYILSHIIHDWNDAKSIQILKNCRQGMKANQTLLLVERVLESDEPTLSDTLSDLHMMVMLSGRERTKEEFETLLNVAGFQLTDVIRTQTLNCIVEAKSV